MERGVTRGSIIVSISIARRKALIEAAKMSTANMPKQPSEELHSSQHVVVVVVMISTPPSGTTKTTTTKRIPLDGYPQN